MKENIFDRVEKKTKVKKEDILKLAKKISGQDLSDEDNLRTLIKDVAKLAGKEVSKEKEEKISGILDICQSTVCSFPAGARRAGLLCPWRICLRGEQHPQGSGQSGTEFHGGDVPEIPHKRCVCGGRQCDIQAQ